MAMAGKDPPIQPGFFETEKAAAKLGEILQLVGHDWWDFGTHLKLLRHELPPKEREDPAVEDKSYREMLDYSLRNPPVSAYKRRNLFEAVKKVNKKVAEKLKEKYDNDKPLKSDDLGMVMEDLVELKKKWRKLGSQLGIELHKLDTFCPGKDHQDKLVEVLRTWMDTKLYDATLATLYHALQKVDLADVAEEIIKDEDVIGLLTPPVSASNENTNEEEEVTTEEHLMQQQEEILLNQNMETGETC